MMYAKARAPASLANWFGLLCVFSGCPGMVGYDKHSVFWRCSICGKMERAPTLGDHWEPLPPATSQRQGN
jgi:hypothetical protein